MVAVIFIIFLWINWPNLAQFKQTLSELAAFCMGRCPNVRNGAAGAAPAVWVSPSMSGW